MKPAQPSSTTRREFLKSSAASTGAVLAGLSLPNAVHAAATSHIRVGLVGCGGRGTEAAINAMNAGPDVRLVAMADIFQERLQDSFTRLQSAKSGQVDVPPNRRFVGFEAYRELLQSGVDVVLIAPASHFIPEILQAAVAAGKHVFCEKPHGIDIPGINICRTAAEQAKAKDLSLVSGLCWRYDPGVRETMQRVLDGWIGDIVAIQETYVSSPYIMRERRAGQTEVEWQLWNWYHFNWLSGDQTAQQLIHSLDKSSWAMRDQPPLKCWGLGGRQTALEPKFGDQFDHHAVVFEYPNGVRVFGFTRDQQDCWRNTSDYIMGTRGRCNLLNYHIEGERNWKYEQPRANMYDIEHAELFASIRNNRPINNGHYMCLSTTLAVMAQMACYTGQVITYADAMESKRAFALRHYAWDIEPPVKPGPDGRYPTAMQGQAELERWRI